VCVCVCVFVCVCLAAARCISHIVPPLHRTRMLSFIRSCVRAHICNNFTQSFTLAHKRNNFTHARNNFTHKRYNFTHKRYNFTHA